MIVVYRFLHWKTWGKQSEQTRLAKMQQDSLTESWAFRSVTIFSECLWKNISSGVSVFPVLCGFSVSCRLTGPEKNPGLRKDRSSELSLKGCKCRARALWTRFVETGKDKHICQVESVGRSTDVGNGNFSHAVAFAIFLALLTAAFTVQGLVFLQCFFCSRQGVVEACAEKLVLRTEWSVQSVFPQRPGEGASEVHPWGHRQWRTQVKSNTQGLVNIFF